MGKKKLQPAAHAGQVVDRLPGRVLLVSVQGLGVFQAKDRSGRANTGQQVTVTELANGRWRVV